MSYRTCNRCGAESALELRSPLCLPCYRDVMAETRAYMNQGGYQTQNARRVKKLKQLRLEDDDDAETVPGLRDPDSPRVSL